MTGIGCRDRYAKANCSEQPSVATTMLTKEGHKLMTGQQPWWNQPAANNSAKDEPTPTRTYDLNADSAYPPAEGLGSGAPSRGATDTTDPTSRYDTDDLKFVRQPSPTTRVDEPTQVLPAAVPPASQQPGTTGPRPNTPPQWHNPQHAVPQPPMMPTGHDLPAADHHRYHGRANVMVVLEEGNGSPSLKARIVAMVIGVLAGLAALFISLEPLIPGSNIMENFSQWLTSTLDDQLAVAVVMLLIPGLIKLVVVCSSLISGLAPMVFSIFLGVQALMLSNMAAERFDASFANTMVVSTAVEAVVFLTIGLVAHLLRGSGYRKALRLVRQASRQ